MENKENALEGEKEDKNKKDKETGVCTEAGKETSCRQSDKRCLVQKSRAKKTKRQMKNASLKIDWGEKKTATSKQTDEH